MTLLHIITGIPKAAGTSTFCGEVCNQLAALGHDVTIAVLNPDAPNTYPLDSRVNLISIRELLRGGFRCSGVQKFRGSGVQGFRGAEPSEPSELPKLFSFVHIHGLWSPILHKVSCWARSRRIPIVWSTHGMTAPWALKHKWWKKCLPWYLYQKRDLKRAALIHCTSDFEIEWNHQLGFKRTFLAPLGTFLPEEEGLGRRSRSTVEGTAFLNAETQRRRAVEKVEEWLAGVDEVTFAAALEKLVEEKTAAGEYRFKKKSEVTFTSTSKVQKKLPRLVPLTEAVRTVVHHQTTAGSYSPDKGIVANSSEAGKGEGERGLEVQEVQEFRSSDVGNTTVDLDLRPRPKTLLFVGRIYPVKALDRLIESFAVALSKLPKPTEPSKPSPWCLRLVGPDQAGHMAELMSLCDRLGLPYSTPEGEVRGEGCEVSGEKSGQFHSPTPTRNSNTTRPAVEFVGPKFSDDLEREYELCDCLALVSHTENFGATIVDAMAHGKPVIASTKTPWKIVSDRRCGRWVDNDVETLSATLSELLNLSTSELLLMGANGKRLVEERFSWDAIARSVAKEYDLIMERGNA